jgi:phosphate/sulfate permease
VWNFFTWSVGLPSSSSHALVGGLVGSAVGLFGSSCVDWKSVELVVQAIFASPVVAVSVACLSMCAARPSCWRIESNRMSLCDSLLTSFQASAQRCCACISYPFKPLLLSLFSSRFLSCGFMGPW